MQRPTVVFLALILFAGAADAQQNAQSQEKYQRKSGLWELKHTSPPGSEQSRVYQLCVDHASDNALGQLIGGGLRTERCTTSKVAKSGETVTVDAVCTIERGRVKATTHALITGKFDSAYKVESKATMEQARHGETERTSLLEAKWLGPCKPKQRPGDLLLPAGRTINIYDAEAPVPGKVPKHGMSDYAPAARNRQPSSTPPAQPATNPPQPAAVPPAPAK